MRTLPSYRRKPVSRTNNWIPTFVGMMMLFFSSQSFAKPYEYTPEPCDFSITFPEKPFIEKKCDPSKPESCEEIVTYTQMSEASSLNFRITCNKEDPKKLEAYKPEDLKSTLAALVKEAGLIPYSSDSAIVEGSIKTSIAMATGKRNDRDVIYIGQMWLGKKSVLILEGELLGPENKKIEDAYAEILKSVKSKSSAPKTDLRTPLKKAP